MSWKDALGPAKFRDVSFFVDTSERGGGRRIVEHEYPFRDTPFAEDLGLKQRSFSIEGYVLGPDYLFDRDALLSALERGGAGELSHPYHGNRTVAVKSFRVRETKNDGGFAAFSIEFVETASEVAQPTVSADAKPKLRATVSSSKTNFGAVFLKKFSVINRLSSSVSGALRSASLAVSSITSTVAIPAQTAANLARQVEDLTDSAADLANEPEQLLAAVSDLVETLGEALVAAGGHNPVDAILRLFSFDPGARPPSTTASRAIEQSNFDATQQLIQRLALAEAAAIAVEQTFASFDEAVAVREAITDAIDSHAESVSDDSYLDLVALRADVAKAIPGESEDLPRILTFTQRTTLPSLVLAHNLYGNLDLELDIVERNKISNPGFILGGSQLEVLSE